MTIMPKVTPAWKVYVSRKLVYIWNMSTHRSTTYVYVQEKKCEPLGTSYTTKSSILNKKTTTVSPFSGSRLFGGCSVSKTTALSYERERERDKGPESYTPVCHHLKQKCKFRDAIIMSNNSFVNFGNLKNHLNRTNESALFFLFKCL